MNDKSLEAQLNPWLNSITGTVGVFASQSKQGLLFAHNSDQIFYLASTYKLPIAVQCLRCVDQGQVKLDQWVEVNHQDIPEYSPILDHRHFSYPGVKLSVQNLIRLMIEYSDNTASDLVLKLAGGIPSVRKFLNEFGFLDAISIDLSIMESFAETEISSHDSATPEAMANFLNQLVAGKFLSASSTQFLLECMQRCKTGTARIRALLPEGTVVASKTGTITGFVHDVGIIDLPARTEKLTLAIYIKETTVSQKEAENVIANISKIIFDHAVSTFP
ncbi:MAG: class A beta-lactamase [Pseudomonadota bacterium]